MDKAGIGAGVGGIGARAGGIGAGTELGLELRFWTGSWIEAGIEAWAGVGAWIGTGALAESEDEAGTGALIDAVDGIGA